MLFLNELKIFFLIKHQSKKLIENKKLENERKINIYEIILNEGVSPTNPIIKLNEIINQNTNDSNNEKNSEAKNLLKSTNKRKTTDSPQLQVDISHRETLDEPRELSFNKEGIINESQDNYNVKPQRESIFSKQKVAESNDPNQRKISDQVKNDSYARKISDQAKKNSNDNVDKNSEHEELEQKINQQFNESLKKALPGNKNEDDVQNFASDIKKIMNNVQNVIAKVEEDRKYGNSNGQKDDIPSNLNTEEQYNNISPKSPLALKVPANSTQINNSEAIISPNNISTNGNNNPIYPDILETKHLIIPPKMTNQILKKQEEKLAQKKLDSGI